MGNACVAECVACQSAQESNLNLEYAITQEFYGQGDCTGYGNEQEAVSIMMVDKPQQSAWPRLMGRVGPKRNGIDKAPVTKFAASASTQPETSMTQPTCSSKTWSSLLSRTWLSSPDASPPEKEVLPKAVPLEPVEELAPKHVGTETRQTLPCLELVFNAEGKDKIVQLYKRPLGAEFSKKACKEAKVLVTKVYPRSYAWGVGLEVGWALKAIDGEDMTTKKFHEVQMLLENKLETLPHRPRTELP